MVAKFASRRTLSELRTLFAGQTTGKSVVLTEATPSSDIPRASGPEVVA